MFQQHYEFMWRNALRLGAPDDGVDDVVQDAFMIVARKLGTFEGRSHIRTWLYGILSRVVRQTHRGRARHERRTRAYADLQPASSEGSYARCDAARTLHRLLGELGEAKRDTFILAELEHMTGPEIAEAMGVKLPTVYSRLRAARAELDEKVRELQQTAGGRSPRKREG